jgi:hypothetical protein
MAMLRVVSLSLLAAVGAAALFGPANADHRWRHRHTFFPLIEVFPGDWDEEDDYARDFDDEDEEVYVPKRLKRSLRAEDKWWLYEDDEDSAPAVKKPVKKKAAKKKVTAAKERPKPVAKIAPQALASTAAATAVETPPQTVQPGPLTPAVQQAPAVAKPATDAKVKPVPKTAAAAAPVAPAVATIGCTAGAAVVTGYGFGDVKPKTCTGDTYSYTASRAGKSYLITLTASSGEVVDVKKL